MFKTAFLAEKKINNNKQKVKKIINEFIYIDDKTKNKSYKKIIVKVKNK